MSKEFTGEKWKHFKIDLTEYVNEFRMEVSNYGRVRTFNKISDGNILQGSTVNGFPVIRISLHKPREEKVQKRLDSLKKQSLTLARKLKKQQEDGESKKAIKETADQLATLRKNLSQKFKDDFQERTVRRHFLIHRMVARCFMKAPTSKQTVLAHLDFDKLNNRVENLKWMTPEENYPHRLNYPSVIKEMQERRFNRKGSTKLTVEQVMMIKKLLNEGKPVKNMVKKFKVSEMQIYRIKWGENWGDIEAAK